MEARTKVTLMVPTQILTMVEQMAAFDDAPKSHVILKGIQLRHALKAEQAAGNTICIKNKNGSIIELVIA